MNTTLRRRAFLRGAGSGMVGLGLMLAGCGLRKGALPARTFVLKGPGSGSGGSEADGGATHAAGAGVLLVRPFKVATSFDSRSFVIRRAESEYLPDAYHAFLVSPGAMLTDLVAAHVRGLGIFASVTTGGSQMVPTRTLEGEVVEMYGDYREPTAPKAVLSLQFRMLHPQVGGQWNLLWQFGARKEVVLPKAGPDALVAGWEEGFGKFCEGLTFMLRQPLPGSGVPQA